MRKWYVIIGLVLGLILIGGGVWTLFGHNTSNTNSMIVSGIQVKFPPGSPLPQGSPFLTMNTFNNNASTSSCMFVYGNKIVVKVEDITDQKLRLVKNYQMTQIEFDDLILLLNEKGGELNSVYQFEGYDGGNGTKIFGDMDVYLSITYQNISKSVIAQKYLSPYSDYHAGTFAGMPSPLADIYQKLYDISLKTQEIARSNIT